MPVTLNIIADNAEQLVDEFRKLNALTTRGEFPESGVDTLSLDTLIDAVRARLRDDGFKLEIIDQRDPTSPASPPETQPEATAAPEPEPKTRGRPRRTITGQKEGSPSFSSKTNGGVPAEIITEPSTTTDEDITLPRPKKASKASPMPLDEPSEPDPAGDRQHVLDTLAGILKDPKAKDRVLTFASTMAKKHGKDKISELPVEPFPEIRQAMEKEFPNV